MLLNKFEFLKDDNDEIIGVPVLDGKFTMIRIADVSDDEPNEDGERELVYDPDTGNLAGNYILAYVAKIADQPIASESDDTDNDQYTVTLLNSGAEICSLFNIGIVHGTSADYINRINKFALELSASTNPGSPVYVTPIDISVLGGEPAEDGMQAVSTAKTLVVMNKVDVMKELAAKDDTQKVVYEDMLQNNPDLDDHIKNHTMVKGYLGKIAEFIQRTYNKSTYEDGVDSVAKYISNITIFDDRGQIVPLTVSSLENFFTSVKNKIYLG